MFRTTALLLLAAASAAADPAVHDPTQPFTAAPPSAAHGVAGPQYRVTAVLISPSRRIAIVNGGVHREGDIVDGAEIVRIDIRAVQLKRGTEQFAIRLDAQPSKGEPGP